MRYFLYLKQNERSVVLNIGTNYSFSSEQGTEPHSLSKCEGLVARLDAELWLTDELELPNAVLRLDRLDVDSELAQILINFEQIILLQKEATSNWHTLLSNSRCPFEGHEKKSWRLLHSASRTG